MSARDQYEDPHFRARGSVEELDDQVYGRVVDYGPAPQLSATPARHKWAGRPVGWHNRHVLKGILGLPDEEIAELERRGDRRPLERPPGRRGRPTTGPARGIACERAGRAARARGGPTGRERRRIRGARPRSRRRSTGCSCSTAPSAHYGGHVLGGFLGELGAEVVKLEPPGGDPARAWGPADAAHPG